MAVIIEGTMLLADRLQMVEKYKTIIADLEKKGDSPAIQEQIDRLVLITGRQERIIDEAGREILRHMR
jgi:hypothetical protein